MSFSLLTAIFTLSCGSSPADQFFFILSWLCMVCIVTKKGLLYETVLVSKSHFDDNFSQNFELLYVLFSSLKSLIF